MFGLEDLGAVLNYVKRRIKATGKQRANVIVSRRHMIDPLHRFELIRQALTVFNPGEYLLPSFGKKVPDRCGVDLEIRLALYESASSAEFVGGLAGQRGDGQRNR